MMNDALHHVKESYLLCTVEEEEFVVGKLNCSVESDCNHCRQHFVLLKITSRSDDAAVVWVLRIQNKAELEVVLVVAGSFNRADGFLSLVSRVDDAVEGFASFDVDFHGFALASRCDEQIEAVAILENISGSRGSVCCST